MSNLRLLSLCDCEISDAGLLNLPSLPALETLHVINSRITDAGLMHLLSQPSLQNLDLVATEITDVALLTFAQLPKLRTVNVSLTAVTEAGAKRFLAVRPDVKLWFGASDKCLGEWLFIHGHWNDLYNGIAPCRPNPVVPVTRLHLRGTTTESGQVQQVTDAALVALSERHELEELDVRDTAITDRGLRSLATLGALRRLDVRGTAVSELAVAELFASLPNCQIISYRAVVTESCAK